ncbi:hypothetical protein B0T14DRAFT_569440 [Immersiella caudata]|uniref:Uncharacterized protein n=1 Tax=Immersiella caudata TaxID=314043 RepID=A0AA39WDH7_9PEZI|nr:hypothetical protein B0T14DRAFT_569440 [Immersiella caudata]
MRHSGEIASIESRLNNYHAELNFLLLGLVSEQQSSVKLQLDAIQEGAEVLSSSSAVELKGIREDVTALLRVAAMKDDDSCSDEEELNDQQKWHLFESLDSISAGLRNLEQVVSVVPREARVLENLYFDYKFSRHDSIQVPRDGAFKWITMSDSGFETYLAKRVYQMSRA